MCDSPRFDRLPENTESARRQYGLSRKAMALGWPTECIRVIDDDQGKSGADSGNRSGFRDLMARIAAGEVGIVLGLESLSPGARQRRLAPAAAHRRYRRNADPRRDRHLRSQRQQ